MTAAAERLRTLRCWTPVPAPDEAAHGGLKLDATSALGRTGVAIDWEMEEPPVEAGMPAAVAHVLARALCARHTVVGGTAARPGVGAAWSAAADGAVRTLRGAWWQRADADVGLLASRDPDAVARLFDDDAFAWAHEAQLLCLAPAAAIDGALPPIDRALLDDAAALPFVVTPARLAASGLDGIVRAGVDGAVAGVYVPNPAARAALLDALADAARDAGARWEVAPGSAHPVIAAARRR